MARGLLAAPLALLLVAGGCGSNDAPTAAGGGGSVGGSSGSSGQGVSGANAAAGAPQAGAGDSAGSAGQGLGGTSGTGSSGSSGAAPAAGSGGSATPAAGTGGTAGSAGAGPLPDPTSKAWYPQDISFTSQANLGNPYLDVTDFKVTFTGPGGTELVIPGFYTGGGVWKVRFAPTSAGAFSYVTSSARDPSLHGLSGTVTASRPNPNGHGALKVDPARPHHYVHEDGTRPFQMGYELDWLGLMDFGDANIPKAKALIDMIAENGFNEVILNVYAHDTTWKSGKTSAFDFGPPAEFAWGGSHNTPDHGRMNEAFWQNYDRVVAYLFEKGITAHLFFRVYNKLVKWPANASPADDLYFRYVVARYQAYSNVVWDFSKESFYEKDHAYIRGRLNLIGSHDAYDRLRTVHDSDGGQNQYSPNYYDSAANAGTVDFYTDQSDNQYSVARASASRRAMPYYNSETTLYQIGNDGTYTYSQRDPKEDVFAASMEVVMAGGYFAYYYTTHAWDVVRWNEVPEGIAAYKYLSDFMKSTHWYELTANDALITGAGVGTHCLANPGKEYIVYKQRAGNVTLTIASAAGNLTAKWRNLVTNQESALPAQTNGARTFTNPWNAPAVLHLVAN